MIKRRLRANISIMVAVFCVAFFAFCAFGVDMAYITLNRAKLQRATETCALASLTYWANDGVDRSEELFNLFKSEVDTIKDAVIVSADYKDETDTKKIALSTYLMSPTYFLRFAGVGGVKIEAKSYAQTSVQKETDKQFGDEILLETPITDKTGNEFSIKLSPNTVGYFVFGGRKNAEGNIVWADLGCKADKTFSQKDIEGKMYNLICEKEVNFDLSKACADAVEINTLNYLKLFKANPSDCSGGSETSLDDTIQGKYEEEMNNVLGTWQNGIVQTDEFGNEIPWDMLTKPETPNFPITKDWIKDQIPTADANPFELTVLNNVKLISGKNF